MHLSCVHVRALLVVATAAVLIAGPAEATLRKGVIDADVTRGPNAPVCVAELPCSSPAPGVTLLFVRNGDVVGRGVSDAVGHFRLRLPPGVYEVRRRSASSLDRKLDPNRVRVYSGRLSHVDFSIDTGIR